MVWASAEEARVGDGSTFRGGTAPESGRPPPPSRGLPVPQERGEGHARCRCCSALGALNWGRGVSPSPVTQDEQTLRGRARPPWGARTPSPPPTPPPPPAPPLSSHANTRRGVSTRSPPPPYEDGSVPPPHPPTVKTSQYPLLAPPV